MSVAHAPETWSHRFPASERREHLTRNLLVVARSEDISPADAATLRNEAVVLNRVLALAIARRYHRKGVEDEDLDQVAMVGLCLAVDRWDPTAPTPFVAFAAPTISGEIKRHFRDRAWLVRPPRSVQNRVAEVRVVAEELRGELGREPSAAQIAARLHVEVGLVNDARKAGDAFHGAPLENDDAPCTASPVWRRADDGEMLDSLAESIDLRRAVERLSERDRRLVKLRFVDELTQQEVGRALGVSQMQVSRLLVRLLASLRQSLDPPLDGSVTQTDPPTAA
ncbi:MAG: sigma-70 family RNA polymerase sigma factor [Lapillicoccus sp.]